MNLLKEQQSHKNNTNNQNWKNINKKTKKPNRQTNDSNKNSDKTKQQAGKINESISKNASEFMTKLQDMIDKKMYIEAEIILTEKIQSNPRPNLFYLRSQCNYHLEYYFLALNDINEVLKAPHFDSAKFHLRYRILSTLSLHELALADLERVILLDPSYPGVADTLEKLITRKRYLFVKKNSHHNS